MRQNTKSDYLFITRFFIFRYERNGRQEGHFRRMQEQISTNIQIKLHVLAPSTNDQFSDHPSNFPGRIRRMLRFRLGQHFVLDQKAKILKISKNVAYLKYSREIESFQTALLDNFELFPSCV